MFRSRLGLTAAVGVLTVLAAQARAERGEKAPPDLRELPGILHLVYSPDGKSLLIHYQVPPNANGAHHIGVWDVETGKFRVGMEKPPSPCERIALSPDGSKAAAISAGERQLKVWDAATGKLLEEFKLPEWKKFIQYAPFLAFSPDGGTVTSVFDQKVMRTKLGGEVKMLPDEPGRWSPENTAFSATADLLVFAYNPPVRRKTGSKLQVFDLSKSGEPQTMELAGGVSSIALSGDGKTLIVSNMGSPSGEPGAVELWDTATWKVRATLPKDTRKNFWSYHRLVASPDGQVFVGQPDFGDPKLRAVELLNAKGTILREITATQPLSDVVFSPDGKMAAVVIGNLPVQFLDAATGKDKEP